MGSGANYGQPGVVILMDPNQGGTGYQPAQWAAVVPGGGASFGRGLREAGLTHDCGVPSFEAFEQYIEPGCNCFGNSQQVAAINDISARTDADLTLTRENKELVRDMLNHFSKYSNTTTRGCGLGWGIFFIINAIWEFAVLSAVAGGVFLALGLALVACWAAIYGKELCRESKLREREEAAVARIRGGV
jgi:hypothetical protein